MGQTQVSGIKCLIAFVRNQPKSLLSGGSKGTWDAAVAAVATVVSGVDKIIFAGK